ncbi:MAG: hypothetical protein K6E20_02460 [Acholeplasmatales bacterium]|nr:hypothetical protein [Acholeplasmatales bacterium]
MKKKKILFSFAIAMASVVALTSCGGKSSKESNTSAQISSGEVLPSAQSSETSKTSEVQSSQEATSQEATSVTESTSEAQASSESSSESQADEDLINSQQIIFDDNILDLNFVNGKLDTITSFLPEFYYAKAVYKDDKIIRFDVISERGTYSQAFMNQNDQLFGYHVVYDDEGNLYISDPLYNTHGNEVVVPSGDVLKSSPTNEAEDISKYSKALYKISPSGEVTTLYSQNYKTDKDGNMVLDNYTFVFVNSQLEILGPNGKMVFSVENGVYVKREYLTDGNSYKLYNTATISFTDSGITISYNYEEDDKTIYITNPSGSYEYTYDDDKNIIKVENKSENAVILTKNYTYDSYGNILSEISYSDKSVIKYRKCEYTYQDNLILQMTVSYSTNGTEYIDSYTCTYSYSPNDRTYTVVDSNNMTTQCVYDANYNLIKSTTTQDNDVTYTEYEYQGRTILSENEYYKDGVNDIRTSSIEYEYTSNSVYSEYKDFSYDGSLEEFKSEEVVYYDEYTERTEISYSYDFDSEINDYYIYEGEKTITQSYLDGSKEDISHYTYDSSVQDFILDLIENKTTTANGSEDKVIYYSNGEFDGGSLVSITYADGKETKKTYEYTSLQTSNLKSVYVFDRATVDLLEATVYKYNEAGNYIGEERRVYENGECVSYIDITIEKLEDSTTKVITVETGNSSVVTTTTEIKNTDGEIISGHRVVTDGETTTNYIYNTETKEYVIVEK